MRSSHVVAAAFVISISGCAALEPTAVDEVASGEEAMRKPLPEEITSTLEYGETVRVSYSSTPMLRALQFRAKAGDEVTVQVTTLSGARPQVWLFRNTLITSGLSGEGTLSRTLLLPGNHYIVLRSSDLEPATYEVKLTERFVEGRWDVPSELIDVDLPMVLHCSSTDEDYEHPWTTLASFRIFSQRQGTRNTRIKALDVEYIAPNLVVSWLHLTPKPCIERTTGIECGNPNPPTPQRQSSFEVYQYGHWASYAVDDGKLKVKTRMFELDSGGLSEFTCEGTSR
jgi:hypothetical protein